MNKLNDLLEDIKEFSNIFTSLNDRIQRELGTIDVIKRQLYTIIDKYDGVTLPDDILKNIKIIDLDVSTSSSIAESEKPKIKVKVKKEEKKEEEVKKEVKIEKLSLEDVKSRLNNDCKIMFNELEIKNLKKLKKMENRLEKGIAYSLNSIIKYESQGKLIPVQLSTYLKLIKCCIDNKTDIMD